MVVSFDRSLHPVACLAVLMRIASFAFLFCALLFPLHIAQAAFVTTTIEISICGDGILQSDEFCDDGLFNIGGYGSTTAERHCLPGCDAYDVYCGDGILQPLFSEQCDDGNAIPGDLCSLTCTQEQPPTATGTFGFPAGGGGGGGGVLTGTVIAKAQTRVIILGKAYPNTTINLLKDGQAIGSVQSDAAADFTYETSNVTPGPTTFGFWATDGTGNRSITFTTTFQVTQNAVTTVSNVFLPPTIALAERKVAPGDIAATAGATAPNALVSVFVGKEQAPRATASSSATGVWSAAFSTAGLETEAFHTVRAMFEQIGTGFQAKSGYSQALNLYVGTRDVGGAVSADLNGDGRVNLVDFSILLFHWNTDHAEADLNVDSRVNLTDFSILLFNWTG